MSTVLINTLIIASCFVALFFFFTAKSYFSLGLKKLKRFRHTAPGLPDLLNYAAMVDDGVLMLKSGALMASWQYEGLDTETLTSDELNARSARINNALQQLGTGWMTQHDVLRTKSQEYSDRASCHFEDEVTAAIDEERRLLYTSGSHHENKMVVTLTYLPPKAESMRFADIMVENNDAHKKQNIGERHIAYFKAACDEFEGVMSSVCVMTRLKGYLYETDIEGTEVLRDDLLRHVNRCISGKDHPVNLPSVAMYLDSILGGYDFLTGLHPVINNQYIGAISIDGFPQSSFPGILEGLDQHSFEYRWATRFIYEDPEVSRRAQRQFMRKWEQKRRGFIAQMTHNHNAPVDHYAEEMVKQAEQSMADSSSGEVLFGYYTSTIIIYSKSERELEDHLEQIRNHVNSIGFNARIESINTVEAFLGSLPGHSEENLRRPMMHTLNLSDLLPIRSIWPGRQYCPNPYYPPNSPPLLFTATNGNTPFRLNLHVSDLGHSLIFGPTGSGKSTLLAVLAAQFMKYKNAQIFIFDKGYSMYPLAAAIKDSRHYDIANNDNVNFCPLADLEDDKCFAWAEDWIAQCIKLQNLDINPARRSAIRSALAQHRKSEDKTLSDLLTNLQDHDLRLALETYCVNQAQDMAILDAEEDRIETSNFNVFEIEHLMEMGQDIVLPVLTYLFHKIEKSLHGQPSMIILDEAWVALGHPVFRKKIREWLKVLRKSNCFVVLATQSISDAENSGILDVINESCPTKIFLPNPTAKDESSFKRYVQLGLNTREIDLIAQAVQKQDYYFRNPEGRRLFNLQLGEYALAFTGATGKEDIAAIKDLQRLYGDQWVSAWLKKRDVI